VANHISHARHDLFAIAEAVGGAMAPSTVRTCPACGALHRDLRSLRAALGMAWTPRRPRDLLLTTGDAARLRPTLWRRLFELIGSSRDVVTRPLAVGLTGLGIVGLLLTSIPLGAVGGSAASSPSVEMMVGTDPSGTPARDNRVAGDATAPNAVVLVSVGSIALGGSIYALRRIASRSSRVR
jgi:hypothetical protein